MYQFARLTGTDEAAIKSGVKKLDFLTPDFVRIEETFFVRSANRN